MPTPDNLLPPNAPPIARAIAAACASLGQLPVPRLWSADTCPEAALPALAWALSVDEWDDAWPLPVRRAVVAAADPHTSRPEDLAGALLRSLRHPISIDGRSVVVTASAGIATSGSNCVSVARRSLACSRRICGQQKRRWQRIRSHRRRRTSRRKRSAASF